MFDLALLLSPRHCDPLILSVFSGCLPTDINPSTCVSQSGSKLSHAIDLTEALRRGGLPSIAKQLGTLAHLNIEQLPRDSYYD